MNQTDKEIKALDELIFRDVTTVSWKFDPSSDISDVICSVPKNQEEGFVAVSRRLEVIGEINPSSQH